jgi:hypothetical protein
MILQGLECAVMWTGTNCFHEGNTVLVLEDVPFSGFSAMMSCSLQGAFKIRRSYSKGLKYLISLFKLSPISPVDFVLKMC